MTTLMTIKGFKSYKEFADLRLSLCLLVCINDYYYQFVMAMRL